MKEFFEKESYTSGDLIKLIEIGAQESIYLEFKEARSFDRSDPRKKMEIGKDISAFANADGGIIIYGITEDKKDRVARSTSFIDGTIYSNEWIEQVIHGNINRPIIGIRIFPITFNDITESVYIIKIPASPLAPHMASDKYYYRRYNFKVLQMEEYEVRNLYARSKLTELEMEDFKIESLHGSKSAQALTNLFFNIKFQVRNISNQIEHDYKLELQIPKEFIDIRRNKIEDYYLRDEAGYAIFSFPNKSPIFQNELTTCRILIFDIDPFSYKNIRLPLKAKLYYSNGSKSREFNITSKIQYENKSLDEWGWGS